VYGSPYEEGKQAFIDELHLVLASWQGPTLIGGDFNLVRFAYEKSNGNINHKWVDAFNEWVSRWSLMELDAPNKMFTWTNNQENLGMAKLDRVFITTEWEATFPLARVKALERPPSDHNPILLNMGDNVHFGKKDFTLRNGG
jgi:endonuclease/exonuclease/phosphatase family metal-dependent hydrolase